MDPAADLVRRGEQGDPEAQFALGQHYAGQNNIRLARGWLARAAKAGHLAAARELAIHLLICEPIMQRDGLQIIETAAHSGDARAAYICGLLNAQSGTLENRWEGAIAALRDAAARGLPGADAELELLTGTAKNGAPGETLDAAGFAASLSVEEMSATPRICAIRNYLRPALCDWLMEAGQPCLTRASVYDPATGGSRIASARSNSHLTYNAIDANFIIMLIRDRVAAMTGRPLTSLEPTALLHYDPGEEFAPHFDFLQPANPAYAREIAEHGQRVATVLIYLNEDYDGGETEFLELGLRHRGCKGDALLFWNVDAAGAPELRSFHAGRPPTRGEKWLLSQWVRGPAARGTGHHPAPHHGLRRPPG